MSEEEKYLREMLEVLHQQYLRDAQPYLDRLASIVAMRPPPPIYIRVERGPVTQNEAFAIGMAKLLEREGKTIAAAELRRLHTQRDVLLEALQALYDEQQGPPLIRHQAAWEAAMEMARAAIKAVEEIGRSKE